MGVHSGAKIANESEYNYHICTSSGTFLPGFTGNVEVLVVAGGGGGGMDMGGGGGGGGVVYNSSYAVTAGSGITVTIGAGGAGGPSAGTRAQNSQRYHQYPTGAANGSNTVFGTITAVGGGAGGSSYFGYTPNYGYGATGGSGGGASGYSDGSTGRGGSGTAGQGNAGGNSSGQYYSGGGGGAGAAGVSGSSQPNGGAGVLNTILGRDYYWGGGGGGSSYSLTVGGNGGIGGGGGGALGYTTGGAGYSDGLPGGGGRNYTQTNCHGGHGGQSTGGGGGGGSHYNNNNFGGNGGSGIVIIKYPKTLGTSTFSGSGLTPQSSTILSMDAGSTKSIAVEVLVVAGGGGGGMDMGGGGGGGGVIYKKAFTVEVGTPIPVIVGAGGAGAPNQYYSNPAAGSNGGNSIFGPLIAYGGGGGGSGHREPPWGGELGKVGGCGGGDPACYIRFDSYEQGYGRSGFDTRQGYPGGKGIPVNGYHAGGGGGAGQSGGGGGNTYAGNGGQGFYSDISGTGYYWGGGGGGGDHTGYPGNGGAGGGGGGSGYSGYNGSSGGAGYNNGAGGIAGYSATGGAGGANSGGGGGGGSHSGSVGGAGGSGIVIVRYYGSTKATGGTISTSGGYTIHTFTSSGTFTPTSVTGVKDTSGRDFQLVTNATFSTEYGGAYVFNGSNTYININNSATSLVKGYEPFTIEAWYYCISGTGVIVGNYGPSYTTDHIWFFGGGLWLNGGVGYVPNYSSRIYGAVHHLVSTRNASGQICTYFDGNIEVNNAASSVNVSSNIDWRIGLDVNSTTSEPFNGRIYSVKIYNRALSASEIKQNFSAYRGRFNI